MRAKKLQQLREQRAINRTAFSLLGMFLVSEIMEAYGLVEVQRVIYVAMCTTCLVGIARFYQISKSK